MHSFRSFSTSGSFTFALLLTSIASTCLAGVIPGAPTPLELAMTDPRSSLPPSPTPPPPLLPKKSHPGGVRVPLPNEVPRLIIFFQTTHTWEEHGAPISMLPLITQERIALTHLIVCTFHINPNNTIHLNDFPPEHPLFYTLWNETQVMKSAGVKVMGMVGGAAWGSFTEETLDAPPNSILFERSYTLLANTIRRYSLDGMDIDVEQNMSKYGIDRLIRRLRADFGRDFIITLSPVARALNTPTRHNHLSGFDYFELNATHGTDINFFMLQFYNGWGKMSTPDEYNRIIRNNGWDPRRIVAGLVTAEETGAGFVPFDQLRDTVNALKKEYVEIGGIMGWEYFNGAPGGTEAPWKWAQEITAILRPGLWKNLVLTKDTAEGLVKAWRDTVVGSQSLFIKQNVGDGKAGHGIIDESLLTPSVDYMAMVNA